ncbi:hypothetical protein QFC22_000599 [Naganishia vaughanmartiniae]|uniref:Uncharacterized protein n=1 Tax=Naganishia vaughanmartiniae TaxID=1424756 RepID=A0ACC2XQU6_9TREE|nr:hypothetical protein QFC22_000599 [Naganishia vaughanmartiniae]
MNSPRILSERIVHDSAAAMDDHPPPAAAAAPPPTQTSLAGKTKHNVSPAKQSHHLKSSKTSQPTSSFPSPSPRHARTDGSSSSPTQSGKARSSQLESTAIPLLAAGTSIPGPPLTGDTDEQVTSSLIQKTEQALDLALSSPSPSSHARGNPANTANPTNDEGTGTGTGTALLWPVRHLRLRSVRPVDVQHAEHAFHLARQRLGPLRSRVSHGRADTRARDGAAGTISNSAATATATPTTTHAQLLRAHINYLLYLSARIPDAGGYARIQAYLREYGLEPDGWTWLTRLVLVDRLEAARVAGGSGGGGGGAGGGGVVRQLEGVWREFNSRIGLDVRSSEGQMMAKEGIQRRLIDDEGRTVLLNMTIWILAKRGQWSIVGPAYNALLSHHTTADATATQQQQQQQHTSSAFPRDYFTPSHDLSTSPALNYNLFFNPATAAATATRLNKRTYQSLIRALAFHGNIVPALAVMQDMMNDARGYTVGVCDYVSLFQGFARFGTIPVGWEAMVRPSLAQEGAGVRDVDERALHPDGEEEEYGAASTRRERDFFPPPIFPEPLHPGLVASDRPVSSSSSAATSRKDAMKHMTEIWAGNVSSGDEDSPTGGEGKGKRMARVNGPSKLEREWTLVTLQQVFHSFLATSPNPPPPTDTTSTDSNTDPTTNRKYWDPAPDEAPSPRNIYYIMLAFARTTDRNRDVLRAVWGHLEAKFGEGNEEGWVGWRLDARLKRMKEWLGVAK